MTPISDEEEAASAEWAGLPKLHVCPVCGAMPGQPCRGAYGPVGWRHAGRRYEPPRGTT